MFKINRGTNAPIQEFRIANFFACYRPFFTMTLPYECISISLRYTLFDMFYDSAFIKSMPAFGSVLSGALAGSISQVAVQPFFLKNLSNQNCFDQMKIRSFDKLQWVALRGALIGVCHLSVYKAVLEFLEQDLDPFGTKAGNVDLLTQKFILNNSHKKLEEQT